MAISVFSAGPSRRRIAFLRNIPREAQRAFEQRGYECYLTDAAAMANSGAIGTTDSLIISQRPEKPSQLIRDLKEYSHLLDHDCRLYLRYAPDLKSQALVLDTLSRLELPPSGFDKSEVGRFSKSWFDKTIPLFAPCVHILTSDSDWQRLANLVTANPAGRPPNPSLKIVNHAVRAPTLTGENALLLRRAFSDCSSIELFPKTDGMSGVDAFEAFAHLATNVVGGPAPYRCFVKLGPRVKVAREFEKYQTIALENVPFHLGPRLRADRCALGKSQGLITCDYVVGAETLRDSVRDGRSVHVIGNLFNQTLISWRRAATEEQRPLTEYLVEHLEERNVVPEHRAQLIRKYGGTKTLKELKATIAQATPSQPVLVGVIHGDLHATNVLVRMNDAVIIDLERIAVGRPLLLDVASLEGGLLIDGFVGDSRSTKKVLASILPLYTRAALEQDDHACHPADKSTWFVDSVRQIRMQAQQMERQSHQYGWTLAAVLLKKACNPDDLRKPGEAGAGRSAKRTREDMRAMAFVLAEKIILGLSEQGETRAA